MAKKKDPGPAKWLAFNVLGDQAGEYNYAIAELDSLIPVVESLRAVFNRMLLSIDAGRWPESATWDCRQIEYGDFAGGAPAGLLRAYSRRPSFAQGLTEADSIVLTQDGFRFEAVPKNDDVGTRLETAEIEWPTWDAWLSGKRAPAIEGPNPEPLKGNQ